MAENLTGETADAAAASAAPEEAEGGALNPARTRILQFSARRAPQAPESHSNGLKVTYIYVVSTCC